MADSRSFLWFSTTLCLVFATSCRVGFDEQSTDTGTIDASARDLGSADAFSPDAGPPDNDASVDTGADAGSADSGSLDTGAEVDAGFMAPRLRVLDDDILDIWVDVGDVRDLNFRPPGALAAGVLEATTMWVEGSADGDAWRMTVNAVDLTPGTHTSSVVNPVDRSFTLQVRLHVHERFTIGPAPNSCNGACDAVGRDGLTTINAAEAGNYAHMILYGGGGTEYDGIFTTAGPRWISPAVQVARDEMIRLRCDPPPGDAIGGAIKIRHAPSRIEGLRIDIQARCNHAVVTDGPREIGEGQRIWLERLWIRAMSPEKRNTNNIDRTMRLGSYVTVRHSMIDGHFEGGIWTNGTDGLRIENNTLLAYDGPSKVVLQNSTNAVVANNVAVALARTSPAFVEVAAAAQNVLVEGNMVERYASTVAPLPAVTSIGNTLGQIPLDAPIFPHVLADAVLPARTRPSWGLSLDLVDLLQAPEQLPGALQRRSTRALPRARQIVVGPNCPTDCTVDVAEDDEVQRALWLAWPQQEVVLRPYDRYAGRAVISWAVRLIGLGTPEEVVLQDRAEDPYLQEVGVWRHEAVVAISQEIEDDVLVESLTMQASRRFGLAAGEGAGQVELRQLVVRGSGYGAAYAVSGRNALYDSAAAGAFQTCVETGLHYNTAPLTSQNTAVVNFSCRLSDQPAVIGMFGVSSASALRLANIVVQKDGAAVPLLVAQATTSRFTSVRIDNMSAVNITEVGGGGGSVDFNDFSIYTAGTELFVDPNDLRLLPGAAPIDTGGAPPGLPFPLGESLDGIDRTGRVPDQGAYEQGL